MKLCRYGEPRTEKPGLIGRYGRLRDLSGIRADIGLNEISPEGLTALAAIDSAALPLVAGTPRFGVPYTGLFKFICIGLNYSDHAAEAGMAVPSEPIIFLKAPSAVSGPNDPIVQPPHSTKLDWEVELGVEIGSTARFVDEADGLDYVAGYCAVNDVSERAFQLQSSQWDKGKGCDTFGPLGPFLVTADDVHDRQTPDMRLDVNGQRMQTGNTRPMIFGVREIVAYYCRRYMTLLPGDIIATGTPPRVGMGMKPDPVWLKPGDLVELEIVGLGRQSQRVVRGG
ncbi:fumarylacetoacetate hydrolase family protein [Xanthobacter flavus]|uniref:fumarylacetoacetate hydrolase family protein n=1 Tax=Xanthobacter flavus TaxID=281 RepID=UPI001AE373B2|nr:fumarylacetoacetate hydrolase family protein [Xanthobacter flavus]MBP2150843.1 2-keto-4-pentenoate hydratase/2-oxohepta-3-ene-1,7-dioic acid hydratase in catechol pathway [Xanthobacter flavus]